MGAIYRGLDCTNLFYRRIRKQQRTRRYRTDNVPFDHDIVEA